MRSWLLPRSGCDRSSSPSQWPKPFEKMRVEWVRDRDRFAELESNWERLAERQGSPFLRHAWFSAWWTAFGHGRQLEICTVWDEGDLVAALPLCTGRFSLEPLANEHSPAFAPLARDKEALGKLIANVLPASPTLTMLRVPDGNPVVDEVVRESVTRGHLALVQRGPAVPFVDTRGTFAEYVDRRSGNARRDFRRCRRLLGTLPNVEQVVLAVPENVEAEVARGLEVEGSSWKSRRGTAILDSPATTTFYHDVAARFARLGKLRLSTLSVGGNVVAFNFNLLDSARIWGLKGGYDTAYSRYAPGLLLVFAEVERCFELGLSSLELLGEECSWKRKLSQDVRLQWTVGSYARRPVPLGYYGYRRHLRPALRRTYRRLLPGRVRG
jgi:CelD/BcsL family acetyltransferase involved in cellulose biosynthesis